VETGAQSSSPDVLSPGSLPTLQPGSILSELFPALPRDAGWTGFVLQHLPTPKPLLWVQERMAILEAGRIHAAGLGPLGPNLIHVEARDAKAALWAMEEGLRCASIGAVIGELWGDPQALDFTATRRLAVAAERSQVACWLIRLQGSANLSGARERWRLASSPSAPHAFDPKAPGAPRWSAELFRSRHRAPSSWIVGDDEADLLPVAAQPPNRALGGRQRRA
jgi:protein ImuA